MDVGRQDAVYDVVGSDDEVREDHAAEDLPEGCSALECDVEDAEGAGGAVEGDQHSECRVERTHVRCEVGAATDAVGRSRLRCAMMYAVTAQRWSDEDPNKTQLTCPNLLQALLLPSVRGV